MQCYYFITLFINAFEIYCVGIWNLLTKSQLTSGCNYTMNSKAKIKLMSYLYKILL